MGLEWIGQEGDYGRFRPSTDIGNIIDLKVNRVQRGQMGVGIVHHIAMESERWNGNGLRCQFHLYAHRNSSFIGTTARYIYSLFFQPKLSESSNACSRTKELMLSSCELGMRCVKPTIVMQPSISLL